MSCPVCTGANLPDDVSVVDRPGRRVMLQGRINAVVSPDEASFSPFGDHFTVTLYPRRGRVKYLKFGTRHAQERWRLARGMSIRCSGRLHRAANGIEKEVVFDVADVEIL